MAVLGVALVGKRAGARGFGDRTKVWIEETCLDPADPAGARSEREHGGKTA